MKPVKVLHVLGSLNRGGAEAWLMDVMRNTSRDELQLDVCLLTRSSDSGAYAAEFESLGGVIHRCPLRKNVLSLSRDFREILQKGEYRIVHSHVYYFSGWLLRVAAQCGVPRRIAHNHPVEDVRRPNIGRRLYASSMKWLMDRYATDLVGPTKASLAGLWGESWKRDPRTRVIYNGIKTDRFTKEIDRSAVRRELNLPDHAKIVLNVARYSPHKRHELLVEIAEQVVPKRQDVFFLLIGAGERKAVIEQIVTDKGLMDRFRFISGAPDIDRFWLAADVFVFPSVNEGFGIAVVEAGAAGLPVVACDIEGVREAVEPLKATQLLPITATSDMWAASVVSQLAVPRLTQPQRCALLSDFPYTIANSIRSLRALYEIP